MAMSNDELPLFPYQQNGQDLVQMDIVIDSHETQVADGRNSMFGMELILGYLTVSTATFRA